MNISKLLIDYEKNPLFMALRSIDLEEAAMAIEIIRQTHNCIFAMHPRTGELVKVEEILLHGENIELSINCDEEDECKSLDTP